MTKAGRKRKSLKRRRQQQRIKRRVFIVTACLFAGISITAAAATILQNGKTGSVTTEKPDIELPDTPVAGITAEIVKMLREAPETAQDEQEPEIESEEPETSASSWYSSDEEYLLMKIAMAEMEGESTESKALCMLVVIKRVASPSFPDSVREVIYQPGQFTPVWNGRFDRVEPDDDCRAALDLIKGGWDESQGALYFEVTTNEKTWHNTHLDKLFERGATSFYTEKEESEN